MSADARIICLGNRDRGDDAIGRHVAALLRAAHVRADIVECEGEATRTMEALEGRARAILVDASARGGRPGAVRRFDVARRPAPALSRAWSSHGAGPEMAIELCRALGRLPPICALYAVEGEIFERGAPLSAAGRAGAAKAARRIAAEIGCDRPGSALRGALGGAPCPKKRKIL